MSWPEAVLSSVGAGGVFVAVVVLIWQVFKSYQARVAARVTIAQDEAFRRLAEEATAAQRKTAAELAGLTEGVAELRGRVAALEKLLSEVG